MTFTEIIRQYKATLRTLHKENIGNRNGKTAVNQNCTRFFEKECVEITRKFKLDLKWKVSICK